MGNEAKKFVNATVKAEGGRIRVMLTTATKDRHGEVVDPNGLKNVPSDIPMIIQHDSYQLPIGRWNSIQREENGWSAEAYFDPKDDFAQQVKSKVLNGILKDVSIGFIGHKANDINGIYTFTEWELLEASWVTIPANPDAKVISIKSLDQKDQTEKQNEVLKYLEEKAGAVLNKENRENLNQAKENIDKVLESAERAKEIAIEEIKADLDAWIKDVASKAVQAEVERIEKEQRNKELINKIFKGV